MSLKAFHIAFIVISILFTGLFGVWGIYDFFASGSVENLLMGVFSLGLAVALIIYSSWFLKKLKNVSFL